MVRVPEAVAYAAGLGAEMWARLTGKPGIISREKVAEAQCTYWTCDTRRAAAEIGFEARTSLDAGLAEDARVVSGGGVAEISEILGCRQSRAELPGADGGADCWLLESRAGRGILVCGACGLRGCGGDRGARGRGGSAAFFSHWYPLLYVSICYREMSILIPAIRGTDADA